MCRGGEKYTKCDKKRCFQSLHDTSTRNIVVTWNFLEAPSLSSNSIVYSFLLLFLWLMIPDCSPHYCIDVIIVVIRPRFMNPNLISKQVKYTTILNNICVILPIVNATNWKLKQKQNPNEITGNTTFTQNAVDFFRKAVKNAFIFTVCIIFQQHVITLFVFYWKQYRAP